MNDAIETVTALEACIGKVAGPRDLKVIDHLDEGALRWIAASPLGFAAFGDGDGIDLTLAGGEPGFAHVREPSRLRLPMATLDEPHLARKQCGVAALFLTSNIGESLRVNGRVIALDGGDIEIAVEECYVHCAKALLRANFWGASPRLEALDDAPALLAASRFMALATMDRRGCADVSPKGDPQSALIRLHDGCAWFADRPGNRRADSFRNMLVQPRIAIAALVPGSARVVMLSGTARITADAAIRNGFAIAGKTPQLATCVEQPILAVRDSAALARARLWPAAPRAEGIDPAAMFAAHVKLSKARGLGAALARRALSVPGLMERSLRHDYRSNLY